MRLHLRVLLDLGSSPTLLSISLLVALSKPYSGPSKVFLISSLLVVINPLSPFSDPASSLEYFWWTCPGLNRGPEHLSFYFIQQFFYSSSLPPFSPYIQYKYRPINSTANKPPTINQSNNIGILLCYLTKNGPKPVLLELLRLSSVFGCSTSFDSVKTWLDT